MDLVPDADFIIINNLLASGVENGAFQTPLGRGCFLLSSLTNTTKTPVADMTSMATRAPEGLSLIL